MCAFSDVNQQDIQPDAHHRHSEHPPARAQLLDLLHLADSALPIGAQSHSFGLETLTAEGMVDAAHLEDFLRAYIEDVLLVDCVYCRYSYALGATPAAELEVGLAAWLRLNRRLGALRTARETRTASEVLGRRFLGLVAEVSGHPTLVAAQAAAQSKVAAQAVAHQESTPCHHACVFGLAGGALNLGAEATAAAFAQQAVAALLAAAQKLLPIGQSAVTHMRWRAKDPLARMLAHSRSFLPQASTVPDGTVPGKSLPDPTRLADLVDCLIVPSFAPLAELASMRHPALPVRLFIS